MKCSRREFTALCATTMLAACGGTQRPTADLASLEISIPIGEVDAALALNAASVVQMPGAAAPIGIARQADGTYVASLLKCTHRGCEVELGEEGFVCPCHGAEFTAQGAVTQGPATRDLDQLDVREEGDMLVIGLAGEGTTGQRFRY